MYRLSKTSVQQGSVKLINVNLMLYHITYPFIFTSIYF